MGVWEISRAFEWCATHPDRMRFQVMGLFPVSFRTEVSNLANLWPSPKTLVLFVDPDCLPIWAGAMPDILGTVLTRLENLSSRREGY